MRRKDIVETWIVNVLDCGTGRSKIGIADSLKSANILVANMKQAFQDEHRNSKYDDFYVIKKNAKYNIVSINID